MDQRELRQVFGSFVTGVTVITTVDAQGQDQGVTANSFSSVSLDPPLVLWSQARAAKRFSAFQSAEHPSSEGWIDDSFVLIILAICPKFYKFGHIGALM